MPECRPAHPLPQRKGNPMTDEAKLPQLPAEKILLLYGAGYEDREQVEQVLGTYSFPGSIASFVIYQNAGGPRFAREWGEKRGIPTFKVIPLYGQLQKSCAEQLVVDTINWDHSDITLALVLPRPGGDCDLSQALEAWCRSRSIPVADAGLRERPEFWGPNKVRNRLHVVLRDKNWLKLFTSSEIRVLQSFLKQIKANGRL